MPFRLRYILRRLGRSPGYSGLIVLSLSAGVAAVIAMVAVVDTLFFRLPVGAFDPARVVAVGPWANAPGATYPDYVDLATEGTAAFNAVGAFAFTNYTVRLGVDAIPARGMLASHTLLPLLGVRPYLGRWFGGDEDVVGAAPVVIVSSTIWRDHVRRHSQSLGTSLVIAGRPFTVIGVLPDGATAPDLSPIDIVLPITNAPWFGGPQSLSSRDYQWLRIVGRLRSGVSPSQASAEATLIYRRANRGIPSVDQAQLARATIPVRSIASARRDPTSPTTRVSTWLAALALALLLVVCTNVATLVLARGIRERHEWAIHAALGAPQRQLLQTMLLEMTLLVAVSTVCGLALARAIGSRLTSALLGGSIAPPPLDARMGVTAVAVGLLTTVLCGGVPVLRAMRVAPRLDLATGGTTSPHRRRALGLLVAAELALGVVLVSEALAFVASLRNATHIALGVDLPHLLVADVDLHAAGLVDSRASTAAQRVLERLSTEPGVRAVGFTNAAAIPGFLSLPVSVPGRDSAAAAASIGTPSVSGVTASYLSALGIPVRAGRTFTDDDVVAHRAVAIISERFERAYWPNASPLGECVRLSSEPSAACAEIIGVVGDRRGSPLDEQGSADVYVPLGSRIVPPRLAELFPGREVAIRTTGDPRVLLPVVRAALLDAVPQLPSVRIRTGDEYIEREFRAWRLGAYMLGAFGIVTLVLVGVGVFGVCSQAVAQRRSEMGVRTALGASPRQLAQLVALESVKVAIVGLAIGTVGALAAIRATTSLTFGVSPFDIRIMIEADVLLGAIAVLATVLPALRASAIDPVLALRST